MVPRLGSTALHERLRERHHDIRIGRLSVLFEQHRANQPNDSGKTRTTSGRRFTSLLSRSRGLVPCNLLRCCSAESRLLRPPYLDVGEFVLKALLCQFEIVTDLHVEIKFWRPAR